MYTQAAHWPPSATFPENAYLSPCREVGLAISGGGIRSYCLALGQLRACQQSGILAKTRCISAVSGGAWLLAQYSFPTAGISDSTHFSANIVDLATADLRLDAITAGPDRASWLTCVCDRGGWYDDVISNLLRPGESWRNILRTQLLQPMHFSECGEEHNELLMAPPQSWNLPPPFNDASILSTAPVPERLVFMRLPDDRPWPIFNVCRLGPRDAAVGFPQTVCPDRIEVTPLYAGSNTAFRNSVEGDPLCRGGGYVQTPFYGMVQQPTLYGCGSEQHRLCGIVQASPWTLDRVIAASSDICAPIFVHVLALQLQIQAALLIIVRQYPFVVAGGAVALGALTFAPDRRPLALFLWALAVSGVVTVFALSDWLPLSILPCVPETNTQQNNLLTQPQAIRTREGVLADGGCRDNTGVLSLVARNISTIVLFDNTAEPVERVRPAARSSAMALSTSHTNGEKLPFTVDLHLAALFGYTVPPNERIFCNLTLNKVFESSDFFPLLEALCTQRDRGLPLVVATDVHRSFNEDVDPPGSTPDDVNRRVCRLVVCYNNRYPAWETDLPAGVRDVLSTEFPMFPTVDLLQYPHLGTALDSSNVLLLAQYGRVVADHAMSLLLHKNSGR